MKNWRYSYFVCCFSVPPFFILKVDSLSIIENQRSMRHVNKKGRAKSDVCSNINWTLLFFKKSSSVPFAINKSINNMIWYCIFFMSCKSFSYILFAFLSFRELGLLLSTIFTGCSYLIVIIKKFIYFLCLMTSFATLCIIWHCNTLYNIKSVNLKNNNISIMCLYMLKYNF